MSAGWTKSRVRFLVTSAVLVLVFLAAVREVLLPFILAIIVAYVFTPIVAWCERRRVPRAVAILLVYTVTGGLLYLGAAAAAPRLYDEGHKLVQEVPTLTHKLVTQWAPAAAQRLSAFRTEEPPLDEQAPALRIDSRDTGYDVRLGGPIEIVKEDDDHYRVVPGQAGATLDPEALIKDAIQQTVDYIKRNAVQLLKVGQAIVSTTSRGIILTFMTFMCAGYLMHTRDDVMAFFRSLPPEQARPSFDRLLLRIDRGLSGVVRGQLVICVVNGVLTAIGLALLGVKYWALLAAIAAVLSIIPIFGAILSTIPAVLVALTQDIWLAIWVLVWILVIHQLEANLFNPKIIGVAARLHPVLVVFSLIVGEHFFGLWGALLAVPALSIVHSVFTHFRFESLPDAEPDSLRPPVRKDDGGTPLEGPDRS
jgi:predicted PurR-regulated permease PerM